MIRWFILLIPASDPDMENNSSEKSKSSSKWKKLSKELSLKFFMIIFFPSVCENKIKIKTQKRSITKSSNPIESPRFK